MTISEKNIVKRWNIMASKDLGYDRNIEAIGFAEFLARYLSMAIHSQRALVISIP